MIGIHFHCFACVIPLSQFHLIKKRLFFPHWIYPSIFIENQLTVNIKVYFWTSVLFLWSIHLSFMPILHYIDYCRFVINFAIRICVSSIFSLLFSRLAFLYHLHFYMSFRISFSISSEKKASWYGFDRDSVESDQYGECYHLNNIVTPIHK